MRACMHLGLCVWSIFLTTRSKNNYFQKQNKDLTDLVLLGKSNYMLAIFLTTVLFSVAGFPPMIGFLVKMGIKERAEIISKNQNFYKKADIYYRLERLIDDKQMGTLFKVMLVKNKNNKFKLGF